MVRAIRMALDAKIRPTSAVFYEPDPHGAWTTADYKMLEAYHMLQEETCNHCGHPIWLCRNQEVEWDVKVSTCNADKAIAKWREAHADDKHTEGQHPYPVPFTYFEDKDGAMEVTYERLPGREDYFTKLSKEQE